LDWHVDETYIRVGGKWRYLWRAIDANGQLVVFWLTASRDAKAAKAFLNKAIERVRLHRPVSICTDKASTYRKVIREINHKYDPHCDPSGFSTDPLTDLIRTGARQLIERALEAELSAFGFWVLL